MQNESTEDKQEKMSFYKTWRNKVFPVQPTDSFTKKVLKDSAFYLFAVMVILVTIIVGGSIMLVL
ncbi:hypothetical protein LX64_04129 [Chitinophaga skermanii]|uniref:Uncharacterized protein n=1 Tax=Chitinophaga skermanii TaxID=331697 RepID=A0A327QB44_9BACT|nr:hypothetical protein [Chitinophaga skermanii]RAJ00423.1 hypothetical protein LX64_04129 [Chitinophaga skermanii]